MGEIPKHNLSKAKANAAATVVVHPDDVVEGLDELQEMGFEGDGVRYSIDVNEDEFLNETEMDGQMGEVEFSDEETMSDFEGDFVKPIEINDRSVALEVQLNYTGLDRNRGNDQQNCATGPAREEEAMKLVEDNSYLKDFFMKMIQQGIQDEVKKQNLQPMRNENQAKTKEVKAQHGKQSKPNPEVNGEKSGGNKRLVKSPSDTTLYAPALWQMTNQEGMNEELINKISNFVEGVCIESRRDSSSSRRKDDVQAATSYQEVDNGVARQMVIEAEQFKAHVDVPVKGTSPNVIQINEVVQTVDKGISDVIQVSAQDKFGDDDEFFHLTCNVDANLKSKIERGEFVDLEKLLPKCKDNGGCLEWISKEGMTFLSPVQDREQQITNMRRWEQAFRIYSAIYCAANPSRSGEIWQYIYTINSAASTYIWDNVAYYDTTFRQLMAECPGRPWSKTYTQLWQLALCDVIPKGGTSYNSNKTGEASGLGVNQKQYKTWRDNCCWGYNRTRKCTKNGCKFDKRCSYCGAWNHGAYACRKKQAAGAGDKVTKN